MQKSLIVLVIMLVANVPTVFSHLSAAQEKTASQNDERELMKRISFGQTHYKNKAYDKALPNFWLAVELDKSNRFPMLFDKIARCYWMLGKMDSTELAYRKGIAANPNSAHYYRSLGWALQARMQYDEAIAAYKRAIELQHPPKADDYKKLVELYMAEGRFEEAKEILGKLVELQPNNIEILMLYARVLDALGEVEQSLEIYERAWALNPENVQLLYTIAEANYHSDKYERAATFFSQLLQYKPTDVQVLALLASCYQSLEKCTKAIDVYQRLLTLEPQNIRALCEMARCFYENLQFIEAWDVAQKASEIDKASGFPDIVSGEICARVVESCMAARKVNKVEFDDKLIIEKAFEHYVAARSDPQFAKEAERMMNYLQSDRPTKADFFMHDGRTSPVLECYSWLN